ncbi:excisionase family DNA binding protein [Thermosporothrix hazakensis]|jgi:excisionase family DNA binding protein|uniref:Excisionase family DNA binding protein n=2 Tax=Thermosporothrix TaxID=768650 RepID=A0A326UC45_THEHA|nr:helix-turn-helix domain-containing protein [Thermosporothrix hazakensis]PZW36067.1 excisionase family DNA binding protein [Thermosporothrix hazakensis]BBH88533.1 hypothetical protein KTC_32840 [Thermosporothrix sp. COM3]GCE46718.1 hypothetical protein KTH_15870 [Thermosporothrix hazakensis]
MQEYAEEKFEDEFLTVGEVAKILKVDPTTVRRWIRQGSLEAVPLPLKDGGVRRRHRIRRSALNSLLLDQEK